MIPSQPKKWPQALAGLAALLYVWNNPEGAAALVKHGMSALMKFAGGLS
ncbi:hypothetical protein AB0J52_00010 [Spirillospora sp. NPDC049652]